MRVYVYVCGVCVWCVRAGACCLAGEVGGGEEEEVEWETEKNEENTIQREVIKPKPESISAR